ncbi:hypothetical protein [Nonomuraea salmonea]|uniref:hypothetical protein n=1 Tax=Nonomuraea salmonea TaxID=46181 RepID=UPI0031ED3300
MGLHDRLNPALDEAAAHASDYASLLPAGPVAVADMAVAQLWRLEEAGRLDDGLLAEAMAALTSRPEKKLLRVAVEWAAEAALRDATRTDIVLQALVPVLAQDTPALRERAARLALSLAPKAGPRGRAALRRVAEWSGASRERLPPPRGGITPL